jgi:hypothetical protein
MTMIDTPRLPKVSDIGALIREADAEHVKFDHAMFCAPKRDSLETTLGESLMSDRLDALRRLALTIPAVSLADAIVQLEVAFGIVDVLESTDFPEAERMERLIRVRRALASVLPVIAAAARVDLVDVSREISGLCASQFPATPVPAG